MSSKMMSIVEALRDAIRIAMRSDPTVFVMGEDIGVSGGFGGGFTVTLGLSDEFGHDRIMDTPISEIAIVGAAVGAAMTGMKADRGNAVRRFRLLRDGPGDQSGGENALHEQRPGRRADGAAAAGRRIVARGQHGQCTEAFFMHTPGLKVVCPSNAYDAKGLLLAAIRDGNPVVFLEHKLLYGAKGGRKEKTSVDSSMQVPEGDYEVALGTVALRREGTDLTILANMLMLHRALVAAEELAKEGINAEVLDMRCLVPLDMETLRRSVSKTNRVLIVEEDNSQRRLGRRGRGAIGRGRVLRSGCPHHAARGAGYAVA